MCLPKVMRKGIAPAMACRHGGGVTYWGTEVDRQRADIGTIMSVGAGAEDTAETARMLNIHAPQTTMARRVLASVRGLFGQGDMPPSYPAKVQGQVPEQANCYTDGGLVCPTAKEWSLRGFGAWWPGMSTEAMESSVTAVTQYVLKRSCELGTSMWNRCIWAAMQPHQG